MTISLSDNKGTNLRLQYAMVQCYNQKRRWSSSGFLLVTGLLGRLRKH